MITPFLFALMVGAIVYFLLNYLDLKIGQLNDIGGNGWLTILLVSVSFIGGTFLAHYLGSLVPPERYDERDRASLSSFIGGSDNIYAVIEKEDIVFLVHNRLVRSKKDEKKEIISFLPEGSTVLPQYIDLKAKRSGFGKYFFLDQTKRKFFIPLSGIEEGEVKFVERYEFIPEK